MKYVAILFTVIGVAAVGAQEARVVERGAHHSVYESVKEFANADGSRVATTNRYVQLADGLNFWDGKSFLPAEPRFRLENGRAIADQVQHKIVLAANLNQVGAVSFETPRGQVFRSAPLMLVLRDPSSGQGIILGQIVDTEGVQTAPDTVIYPKAFGEEIAASIRYTCRLGGIEQDVILEEEVNPKAYNFPENSRIEMWTETYDWAVPKQIGAVKAGDLDDVQLKFEEFVIGQGKAFSLEGRSLEIPMAKRFGDVEGRHFLVEIVECQSLKPILKGLPQRAEVKPGGQIKQRTSRELLAAVERGRTPRKEMVASIRLGDAGPRSGVVLDYSTAPSSATDYTFSAENTYLVTSTFTLAGVTKIEGGAIIRFQSGASLNVQGDLITQTSPYRSAVLTAVSDNSVGEWIAAGPPTSRTYGSPALNLNPSTPIAYALHDLQIRFANEAIRLQNGSLSLTNVQIVRCAKAFYKTATASTLTLRNVLIDDVGTVLDGANSAANAGYHVTFHRVTDFFQGTQSAISLYNGLLVCVTNTATRYTDPSGSVVLLGNDVGVFAPATGAGNHYLAEGSPYRNAGVTLSDPQFVAEMRKRTTYPPAVIGGIQSGALTLRPKTPRDSGVLDLGYHYSLADYLLMDLEPSGLLTLTNGVVVAGAGNTSAIRLGSGSSFNSEGTPTQPNRVVWCNSIQEQPVAVGANPGSRSLIEIFSNVAPAPSVRFRFTETSLSASEGNFILCGNGFAMYNPSALEIRDCQIRGGKAQFSPAVAGYTGLSMVLANSLFDTLELRFDHGTAYSLVDYNLDVRNCYLRRVALGLTKLNTSTTTWNLKANVFDLGTLNVTLGSGVTLGASYNGYRTGSARLPGEVNYQEVSTFNYKVGPLGEYYYTLPGAVDTLNDLVDTGDITASAAGLFHHTVNGVTQAKDAGVKVDIGFHYVALDAAGFAMDTDGDGVSDVLEDRNGDGVSNNGETNWQVSNTGISGGIGLLLFTPLK